MLNQTAQQPPQSQQRQQNQPPSPQSAFTNQQFQLLKSQLQAFKYFVRAPGQGQGQIPQNLIAYVSNPSSAMANDMYLPAVNRPQTNGMDRTMQMPQSIPSQPQQYALQQQNDLLNLNPKSTGGTPEIPEKKKESVDLNQRIRKPTKKQLREEEQRLALEKQRQELEQNRLKSSAPQAFPPQAGLQGQAPFPPQPPQQSQQHVPQPPPASTSSIPPGGLPQLQPQPQQQQQQPSRPITKPATPQPLFPDPSPPVNIKSVVPDKANNKKVIIPVTKPNIEVDTFELFDIISDEVKDIPFNTLYAHRVDFKSLRFA